VNRSFIDPSLLVQTARDKSLTLFLCGPGIGSAGHDSRKYIQNILTDDHHCEVVFGEDLDKKRNSGSTRADLQTLETAFAHKVDFTILMLNSPGSIAELGTFSMIPNIMHRLYVIVPRRFFDAKSYIARGPLSLMSSASNNNIFYIEEGNDEALVSSLNFPVMMYKYIKASDGKRYAEKVTKHFRNKDFERGDYEQYFLPQKASFIEALTASAIFLHGNPTFSELMDFLHLEPKSLTDALSKLFQKNSITKSTGGRYILAQGLSSPELEFFDKNKLSKRRSHQIAFS